MSSIFLKNKFVIAAKLLYSKTEIGKVEKFFILKKMKIKKSILALVLVLPLIGLWLGAPILGAAASEEDLPDADVIDTLENIADWLYYILLGAAVVFIVIGGIYYATAQGDPEKIKKAGNSILYALVGVVVASLAKGLVTLIQKFPQ